MYKEFYHMEHTPFARGIPAEHLYDPPFVHEARQRLLYAARGNLFAVVTGECGTGKSTLLRRVCAELEQQHFAPVYISDSGLTPATFYRSVLLQLGFPAARFRGDAKRQLAETLRTVEGMKGARPVCICDESHLFSREMLEEIRFILNSSFDSVSTIGLILCGQPELNRKLRMEAYTAIRQRIDLRCTLRAFDRAQTGEYVECQLTYSGIGAPLFTDKALDLLFEFSGGIARMIDKACTSILMYGAQAEKRILDDHDVQLVLENEFA